MILLKNQLNIKKIKKSGTKYRFFSIISKRIYLMNILEVTDEQLTRTKKEKLIGEWRVERLRREHVI